jgi:hypothetical protein
MGRSRFDMKWNTDRAELIVLKFQRAYKERTHLFKYLKEGNLDAPQHKTIPEEITKGSVEHVLFLFFANLMTYSNSSDAGFLQAKELWENHNWAFSINSNAWLGRDIKRAIAAVGFVYPNALGVNWKRCSESLHSKYDGNPVLILHGMKSISEIMKIRKKDFPGLGPKLFSLLALFYEELKLLPPMKGAFPVDLHIQNQCMGTGIVSDFTKDIINSSRLAEFIRPRLYDACSVNGISTLDMSHAMWFTGNRLCQYCKHKRAAVQDLCPVVSKCSGRVSTKSYRSTGKWDLTVKENKGSLLEGR